MRAGRPAADFDFFDRVIDALRGTCLWYLTGLDGTKQELVDYLDKYKSRDATSLTCASTSRAFRPWTGRLTTACCSALAI